jgi:hypothetical protein
VPCHASVRDVPRSALPPAPRRARGSVHGGDWGGQLSCSLVARALIVPCVSAALRAPARARNGT